MAKRLWNVEWELIMKGHSQHEADSIADILTMHREGELISDFGDPDEFEQEYEVSDGWKIDRIEEVK